MQIKGLYNLRSGSSGLGKNITTFRELVTEYNRELFSEYYLPELEPADDSGKIFYRTRTRRHTDTIFENVHWLLFSLSGELLEESTYDYAELPIADCYIARVVISKKYTSRDITYIIRNSKIALNQYQSLAGIEYKCENTDIDPQAMAKIRNIVDTIELPL